VSAYIKKLIHETERDEAEELAARKVKDAAARREREVAARDRLTPLEDRLARLLTTIPLDVQKEGLCLPAVQAGLRGRWRGNCHPGELGAALRRLGFVRRRNWGGENGSHVMWRKA
jgi:hypothetical protein